MTFAFTSLLTAIEMAGPVIAERNDGGTPWHAHHIAERYGLLVIIALGEGVVGTVASLSAVIEGQGWTLNALLVCIAGTGLTFGMWWMYYIMPGAEILFAHRSRPWSGATGTCSSSDQCRNRQQIACGRLLHRSQGPHGASLRADRGRASVFMC